MSKKLIAVDVETTGGLHPDPPEEARVAVVSYAYRTDQGIYSAARPFAHGGGDRRGSQTVLSLDGQYNESEQDWWDLLGWLLHPDHWLVFHNAKFDLMHLLVGTPEWPGLDLGVNLRWDVMIADRELDPNHEHGLEDIEDRVNFLSKDERPRWLHAKKQRAATQRMEWKDAEYYAATDAAVTLYIAEQQIARYQEGEGNRTLLDEELAYTRALLQLERRGIGYDARLSNSIAAQLYRWEGHIRAKLPFRATLPGAKKFYFIEHDYIPEGNTATGQPKLDDKGVAALVRAGAPHIEEFQLLRKLETARTKWYGPYAEATGHDGRLRTVYSQAKVQTGRLSATRINLQAMPHDYQLKEVAERFPTPRQLIVARSGYKLWELDLSQAELRVAAKEANCLPMLKLIEEGADIHGAVTEQILEDTPGSPTWFENRQVGKRGNFSFIFGIGPEEYQASLVRYADIHRSLEFCYKVVTAWRKLYPEFKRAIYRYMEDANRRGWVPLVNGRPRYFQAWDDEHKAFNAYVQGSLAELMKLWLLETEEVHPGVALLTIHDSQVVEVPDTKEGEEVVESIRVMGQQLATLMFDVPFEVDKKEWDK